MRTAGLLAILLLFSVLPAACAPARMSESTKASTAVHPVSTSIRFQNSATPAGNGDPGSALESFMEARWSKQSPAFQSLLSDELKKALETNEVQASGVNLFQASNPCWYRYEVLQLDRPATDRAVAQVRVYEHQWGGDIAGGVPRSWEQEIDLVEAAGGWKVDHLSAPRNTREEPAEPHGPTISACKQTGK